MHDPGRNGNVLTGGVDLAADPKRTAACRIDWATGEIELIGPPVDDDAIVALTASVERCGWDVPLGWPDGFVALLRAHHDHPTGTGGRRSGGVIDAGPEARRQLRYRLTDRRFAETGLWPLSVSTDLIGVPALRAAALQRRLGERGVIVDRSGTTGAIAETYPAGALAAWDWPARGYKGAAGSEVRAGLVRRLVDALPQLTLTAVHRGAMAGSDDRLDAFICALVARAVSTGRGSPPPADDLEVARREGWIHIAAAAPAELVGC